MLFLTIGFSQTYNVNTEMSLVKWSAKKLTGGHNGSLKVKSGSVEIKDDKIIKGTIVVDMKTIVVLDIERADSRDRLENHLKSPDFFSADSFPEAKFTFASVNPKGKDEYVIKGDLEIKGISHPTEVIGKINLGSKAATATGNLIIDRTKYNVKHRSAYFFPDIGDRIIYDDFRIDFDIVTERK